MLICAIQIWNINIIIITPLPKVTRLRLFLDFISFDTVVCLIQYSSNMVGVIYSSLFQYVCFLLPISYLSKNIFR